MDGAAVKNNNVSLKCGPNVAARSGANWCFKSRRLTHDIAGESGLKPVGL